MPEPIERDYTLDDLQMLQRAQVFHNNFVVDKAAFVADFPNGGGLVSAYSDEVWIEGVV